MPADLFIKRKTKIKSVWENEGQCTSRFFYYCITAYGDLTRKKWHYMKKKIVHRTWRKADLGSAILWPWVISVSSFNASPSEVWHVGGGYCATKPGILTLVRSPWTPADTPKVTPGTQTYTHCGQGGVLQLYLSACLSCFKCFHLMLPKTLSSLNFKHRILCISLYLFHSWD